MSKGKVSSALFVVALAVVWYRHHPMQAQTVNTPHVVSDSDAECMQVALAEARLAGASGEVPIGAIVVLGGVIVASGRNAPIALKDPTAHAEVLALRAAAERAGNYRIPGAVLYTTVEPCAMCVGAAVQARVARVVFGCTDPKAGALGSVHDLLGAGRTNHSFAVNGGVCAEEAKGLLQEFFRMRRGA